MSGRVTRDGRAAWTGLAIDFNDHRLGDWGAHGMNALVVRHAMVSLTDSVTYAHVSLSHLGTSRAHI